MKMVSTEIRFSVMVPVLSVQMTVVEPRVSTESRFLINAIFLAIRLEAMLRHKVTVGSNPSGTFATIMPMANIMLPIRRLPVK